MRRVVLLLLALLAAAPMGPAGAAAPDPTFSAQLHRGPCFGTCPSYQVSIDAAGQVIFSGWTPRRSNITSPCPDERRWRVPASSVARLERLIDRSGFFDFQPSYQSRIMDIAGKEVTITRRGRTATVAERDGLMVGMPRAMIEIEEAIDRTAQDERCLPSA
jgi:hypothetical protein